MSTQRYSVTPHPIETLLTWVKSGETAIAGIQRPFVSEPTTICDHLRSLRERHPGDSLMEWRNPKVHLKIDSTSTRKGTSAEGVHRDAARGTAEPLHSHVRRGTHHG